MMSRLRVLLLAGLTASALALCASAGSSTASAVAAEGKKLPNGKWLDILKTIDPAKDCIDKNGGALWKRRGNTLIATPAQRGRTNLFAPVSASGNYDLQVKFLGTNQDGYVYLYLPVAASAVSLQLAGRSGLADIEHRGPYSNGTGTTVTFQANRAYTVDVKVVLDKDDAAIAVNLDGKPLLRWNGAQKDLSSYTTKHKDRIGLAAYDTVVTFGAVRLRMQSGTATALRP